MDEPQFNAGDAVRRKSAPDIVGIVRSAEWDDQSCTYWYVVQFGTATRSVSATDIEALPEARDWVEDLISGRLAGAATFHQVMTCERLTRPPTRIKSSFGSAKAAFYPYQFKPLLKFLENPHRRLLIADDVGLGKTIEAGYILRELRARGHLERVLIVVPAQLRGKWQRELERRFDERFEIVRRPDIVNALNQIERGESCDFAWITSYESLRDWELLQRIRTQQPDIDLVIADEAHRMRNRETIQNQIGHVLGQCAEAMVFLTATPIQNGLDDLYQLLCMLEPNVFSSNWSFHALMSRSKPIVRALNAIRRSPPGWHDALKNLESSDGEVPAAGVSPSGHSLKDSKVYAGVVERLRAGATLSRQEVIDLQRDLSEMTVTAHVLSRTRKRDVQTRRAERRPVTHEFALTPEEQRFYDGVADLVRLCSGNNGWGDEMGMLTAYRYTASCIPAAVEYFKERVRRGGSASGEAAVDEDGLDGPEEAGADTLPSVDVIERIVDRWAPKDGTDTKFDVLESALREIWQDDDETGRARRKVVVFSYFRRTVSYLSHRLARLKIDHRVMDGGTPLDERERIIEEFVSEPEVRVLVSSEVGSEGLDLQRASVVLNYDLPWNPMVVEQRIGRLDRIGQASPTVTVVNLVAKETIEDRILFRLYKKIGVFRESIGEIEPILGDKIGELAREALRGDLPLAAQMEHAEAVANAIVAQQKEAGRLIDDADGLIAADQAFLDEIEALRGRRRVPSPAEMHRFISEFYAEQYPGSRIEPETIDGVGTVALDANVGAHIESMFLGDREAVRLAGQIAQGPFPATFSAEAVLERPRALQIYPRHPLVRFPMEWVKKQQDRYSRVYGLAVDGDGVVEPGWYMIRITLLEVHGTRSRNDLLPSVYSYERGRVLPSETADSFMVGLLDHGRDLGTPCPRSQREIRASVAAIDAREREQRAALEDRETRLDRARAEARRDTLLGAMQARVQREEKRLETLLANRAKEVAIRMAQGSVTKAKARCEAFEREVGSEASLTIELEQLALAHVLVQ